MIMEVETQKELNFLKTVLEKAPVGILAVDGDGVIKMLNNKAIQLLELSEMDFEPESDETVRYISDLGSLYEYLRKFIEEKRSSLFLEGIKHGNNYLTIRGRLIMDNLILTISNISNLREVQAQSMLSMLEGQEIERKRLSKEIHDGLGPLLSTIRLNLESLSSQLDESNAKISVHQKLANIYHLIDTLAHDMRYLSHALMPKVLEDFGLGAALESLCSQFNDLESVELLYYDGGFSERLTKSVELNIYRIAQELLNNAIKHSGANKIILQLIRHPESIVLMVEDNGIGFNKDHAGTDNPGIGLKNIQTRTKMLGGTFFIDSSRGEGVTATCEIPLNINNDEKDSRIDS
jgi:signal transduction histidine kinase